MPVLQQTCLGWIFTGNINIYDNSNQKSVCNFTTKIANKDLNNSLTKFWQLEELTSEIPLSKDEQYCEDYFKETTTRNHDGRFIVKYPFKQNITNQLGNSKTVALKRLKSLETRLSNNEDLKSKYVDFMREYESLRHMTFKCNLESDKSIENKSFFLPHTAVLRDSVTTKYRVVFDACAKTNTNISFNDLITVGPTIQEDLFSILLRLRLRQYVLIADVKMMYRCIFIDPSERCYQQILWRWNTDEPIKVYELNTVTYGTSSAPFQATRCLKELAIINKDKYPRTSKIIETIPPEPPIILDKWGRHLNGSVGPHEVGDDIVLTCRAVGGHPQPTVRWLINGIVVDDEYEHNAGDVIENRLTWPSVSRKDLDAIFTCQAQNTKLTEPKEAVVLLDLILKPLTVGILNTESPLVADKRYEVSCESAGSRPPAIITWYKGKRQLRRTKEETMENVTISELSFVPTTEDDGKSITCRAENPNVTGLFLETSWKIDVVYPPIVDLNLGSTLNADDIKEGDDVYFECKVRANPHWRRLTWLHNDVVLPHNMSSRIIHSNQSLVLQKVTKQSAGIYRCSVVNSEGETVSDELHFRVQYAPTCKYDKLVVVGASRGESIDVVCEIESDPPAKSYKWKFNNSGETLDLESERFAKTSNGTASILKYTPITELDYGSLSCWATNIVGHQINPCSFQVVAAGKPFPVKNCTLTNQTSNSVEVYCQAGFDGGLPQHFLLELYSANSPVPRYNVTSYTEPYFFLDNLETDVTFRIVVFAINVKGRSNGVILEEVTFRDAEKRTANDGDLGISPVLGILIGATITVIIIITIVIVRVRRSQSHPQVMLEEKIPGVQGHCNTMSSTKPLLRSASPRDLDEKDPDVIPAKYGTTENDNDNHMVFLNGSQVPSHSDVDASPSHPCDVPGPQWSSPVSPVSIKQVSQYHQYSNPVAMVGTFPRDARPKDLCLGNGNSSTLARTSDLELNGLAIKERLMANRLPESCV